MKISRRRFVGFGVGATAGLALGVPSSKTLSDLVAAMSTPVYPPRGPEDFVLSICQACPGGCGLRARRVGGRAVKLEGNPLHPINGGRLCPRGQAALQSLYHPDRVPDPLRRVGPRGEIGSFAPASWEDAFREIGESLQRLRRERRPESLVLLRGPSRGIGARLAQRFLQAFGSPNDLTLQRGSEAERLALFHGQGVPGVPAYDLQNAEYVLSFGAALLEASSSPVHTMRAYGEFRQGRPGRRGKLVQVEPRMSITAAAADEWVPVPPGCEGVLALGIAHVLVTEGLYSADFLHEMADRFEDYRDETGRLRRGLRRFLEEEYPLERVAAATGLPGYLILRLAREFAAARPGLAVGPRRGPLLPGSLPDHLIAQWLNVLVGNLDGPGGILVPEETPLPRWPALPSDPVAEEGRRRARIDGGGAGENPPAASRPEALAEAIRSGTPYPAEILVLLDADPAFASFAPGLFRQALERVPLVVSIAVLPDDSALLADWILPPAHFLESWELDMGPPGVPYPIVSLAQPVLAGPLRDSRPVAEILLALAGRIGGEVAAAFPWKDLPSLIRSDVEELYAARRGAAFGTAFDEAWVRLMERAGWWAPGYRSAEDLWQRMQETGGWWDPFYDHGNWKRVLRTASGRYEFRPDLLERGTGPGSATRETAGIRSTESTGGNAEADGSLALVLFEPLAVAGGTGAELPFLQEILDPGHEEAWGTWVEIHPETAARLGVKDRTWVQVESEYGAIVARARTTPRIVAGAAAIPVGLGKTGGGRWARDRGANPLRLVPPDFDPLSGLPEIRSARVRVRRLSDRAVDGVPEGRG